MLGVWTDPVTAQVMITFLRFRFWYRTVAFRHIVLHATFV